MLVSARVGSEKKDKILLFKFAVMNDWSAINLNDSFRSCTKFKRFKATFSILYCRRVLICTSFSIYKVIIFLLVEENGFS